MTAQIYLIEIGCYLGGTSTTSLTVGTGNKTWSLVAGSPTPTVGMTLRIEKTSDATTYMEGTVITASSSSVTINVTATGGSGSNSAWTLTSGTVRYTNGREYLHASAPGYYDPCVMQAAKGSQSIFGDGKTFGAAQVSTGYIKIGNAGGTRDRLRQYGFFKRTARILVGVAGADYSTFTALLTGTVEQAVVSATDVLFRFRDRLSELRKPIIADRYAGNNVRPNGVAGNPEDLKGRFRPLLRGFASNFQPILCNDSKLIYEISARQINGIGWVKDGGVAVSAGTAQASLAALSGTSKTFTVSGVPTTTISCVGHGFATATMVAVYTTGTPPGGFVNNGFYYARNTGADTVTLHASASDANTNTNPIQATTTGAGTHSLFSMPTPGTYDYYLGSGSDGAYIRLGTRPTKAITVQAWEGANSSDRYPAEILKRVLVNDGGYTSADYVAADITTVNTAAPFETGFWVVGGGSEEDIAQPTAPDEWGAVQGAVTVKDALDIICPGARMWYACDPDGKFRLGQVAVPSGSPVVNLSRFSVSTAAAPTDFNIIDLELVATHDNGAGVPSARCHVKFAPNYSPQRESDLLGDKTSASDPVGGLAAREILRRQYQMISYPTGGQDATVIAKWGVPLEQTFVTALRYVSNATTLVGDLFTLYSVQRDRIRVQTRLVPGIVPATRLGAIVQVTAPRFGCDSGKLWLVIGNNYDQEAGVVTLDLWGAAA